MKPEKSKCPFCSKLVSWVMREGKWVRNYHGYTKDSYGHAKACPMTYSDQEGNLHVFKT